MEKILWHYRVKNVPTVKFNIGVRLSYFWTHTGFKTKKTHYSMAVNTLWGFWIVRKQRGISTVTNILAEMKTIPSFPSSQLSCLLVFSPHCHSRKQGIITAVPHIWRIPLSDFQLHNPSNNHMSSLTWLLRFSLKVRTGQSMWQEEQDLSYQRRVSETQFLAAFLDFGVWRFWKKWWSECLISFLFFTFFRNTFMLFIISNKWRKQNIILD